MRVNEVHYEMNLERSGVLALHHKRIIIAKSGSDVMGRAAPCWYPAFVSPLVKWEVNFSQVVSLQPEALISPQESVGSDPWPEFNPHPPTFFFLSKFTFSEKM